MTSKKEQFAYKILAHDLEEMKQERPEEFESDQSLSNSQCDSFSEERKSEGNLELGKIIWENQLDLQISNFALVVE